MGADSLEHAIAARDPAAARTILGAGARARPGALVALARNGWWACVRLALEHGARPDEPSEEDGELPLVAGVRSLPVLALLLAAGADPVLADAHGHTAAESALARWDWASLRCLFSSERFPTDAPVLEAVAVSGSPACVAAARELRADPTGLALAEIESALRSVDTWLDYGDRHGHAHALDEPTGRVHVALGRARSALGPDLITFLEAPAIDIHRNAAMVSRLSALRATRPKRAFPTDVVDFALLELEDAARDVGRANDALDRAQTDASDALRASASSRSRAAWLRAPEVLAGLLPDLAAPLSAGDYARLDWSRACDRVGQQLDARRASVRV